MTSFRDPLLRRRGAVSFAPDGSQSTRGPMTLLSYVPGVAQEFHGRCGDKHEYFPETPDLAWSKLWLHTQLGGPRVKTLSLCLTFGERISTLKRRGTPFVELPDYVPAEFRTTHVGKLRKALYGTRPAPASWGRIEKRTRQLRSHCWHCVAFAASTMRFRRWDGA